MAVEEAPGDWNIKVYSTDMFGSRFGSGPVEGATVTDITWVNNQPGSANFSMHPLAKNAKQVKCEEREIQIWFDDDLIWWGVPWRANGDLNRVTIGCDGLMSWFMHRFVDRMSLLYTSIDQLTIAWNLLTYAQNEAVDPGRDLNINAAAFAPSGHTRSRNYERNNHTAIFDLLQEFPTLSDGFDFDIVVDGTGSRLWTPYYPKRGTVHSNLKLIVTEERSRGVQSFGYQEDATSILNDVYVTGGTSGDVRFEAHVQDIPSMSSDVKDMQGVISMGDQKDVTWLQERGEKEISIRNHSQKLPAIGVDLAYFGILWPGDQIPLLVDYGFYQINDLYRIDSVQWTPTSLNLTFESPVAA